MPSIIPTRRLILLKNNWMVYLDSDLTPYENDNGEICYPREELEVVNTIRERGFVYAFQKLSLEI